MDVTMGTVRVVLLHHNTDGEIFLWPSVQQQPSSSNIQGIFGKRKDEYTQA